MTEKAAQPPALWTKARGPIIASPRMVELAEAINVLLLAPIAVLPTDTQGFVLPFAVGIGTEIEARIKPDASLSDLKAAIRNYARNRIYAFAVAQPDAKRHNIDGIPIEPVSEENRLAAMVTYKRIQDANEKRRKEREQAEAQAAA